MRISEIIEGSVADRCGALSAGDKIISINHQIISNCTVQEALNILHSSSDTITLQIEKNYKTGEYNEMFLVLSQRAFESFLSILILIFHDSFMLTCAVIHFIRLEAFSAVETRYEIVFL